LITRRLCLLDTATAGGRLPTPCVLTTLQIDQASVTGASRRVTFRRRERVRVRDGRILRLLRAGFPVIAVIAVELFAAGFYRIVVAG
jgi:hypothetical protein